MVFPKVKASLFQLWIFFDKGYSYVRLFLGLFNFITIQYIAWFRSATDLEGWVLGFILVLLVLCELIGYWDYTRGTFPEKATISRRSSPFDRDQTKALMILAELLPEEKAREYKEILDKWTRPL